MLQCLRHNGAVYPLPVQLDQQSIRCLATVAAYHMATSSAARSEE